MQAEAIQLDRIADILTIMVVGMFLVSAVSLAIAAGALRTVIRLRKSFERSLLALPGKTDPMLASFSRLTDNAVEISETLRFRSRDVLDNLEEISLRLKIGAESVEERVKKFGVVLDVVQGEAEELLLDAASTARGVHTAAEVMREKKRRAIVQPDLDLDEDVFDEQ